MAYLRVFKQKKDMSNFSKSIPKDLARELWEFGMPLHRHDIGIGSHDGKPCYFYERYYFYDWSSCDRYRIPTYGEVIDWFSSRGIHITFDVFFTFALVDNVGYLWKISFIDESNGYKELKTISEEDALDGKKGYGGSFELDAQSAIRYAMNLKKNI